MAVTIVRHAYILRDACCPGCPLASDKLRPMTMPAKPLFRRRLVRCLLAAWLGVPGSLQPFAHAQSPPPSLNAELVDVPLPSAKSSLPQLGFSADEHLSAAQEKVLGRLLWRDLHSEPDVLHDPLVMAYLHRLIQTLSASITLPEGLGIRAFVVSDAQVNAFAMPSGLLGINTGLLLNIAQEGELAAVLAHEIGHVSQRHFARGIANRKNDQWIAWAGFAAAVLATRSNNAQSGQVFEGALAGSQALVASRQLSFSRDMEREADAVGFALMREARYDAADMVRMLRRLNTAGRLSEVGSGYAKSHPGANERMANIEGRLRVGAVSKNTVAAAALDFLLTQARVRALLANSSEQLEQANSFFTQQDSPIKSQSRDDLSNATLAAQYGLCLLAIKQQQLSAAQAHWAVLEPIKERHPWLVALGFELSASMIKANPRTTFEPMGAYLQALQGMAVTAKSTANTADMPSAAIHIIQTALKHAIEPSKAEQTLAIAMLNHWLALHPYDDRAWASLAQLYLLQSEPAQALAAQAEQTAAMGIWPSSIQLLSDALRQGESTVPVLTQNRWRDRLQSIRQFAADEKMVLEQFK